MRKLRTVKQFICRNYLSKNYSGSAANSSDKDLKCSYKWDTCSVNFANGEIKNCTNTAPIVTNSDEIEFFGVDIFMNHPHQQDKRRKILTGMSQEECRLCSDLISAGKKAPCSGIDKLVNNWFIESNKAFHSKVENSREWFQDHIPSDEESLPYNHPLLRSKQPKNIEIHLQADRASLISTNINSENIHEEFSIPSRPDHQLNTPDKFKKTFWNWLFQEVGTSVENINIYGCHGKGIDEQIEVFNMLTMFFKLHPQRRKQVTLSIYTELDYSKEEMNLYLNKLRVLGNFSFIKICPYLSGVFAKYDYFHNHCSWQKFEGNVHWLINEHKNIGFTDENFLLSFHIINDALTISGLSESLRWIASLSEQYSIFLGINPSLFSQPNERSVYHLPKRYILYFKEVYYFLQYKSKEIDSLYKGERLNGASWTEYLLVINNVIEKFSKKSQDLIIEEKKEIFLEEIEKLNEMSNLRFKNICPEMNEFH